MKFKLTDIARVQNEERFKQPLLFDGMNVGKMYPTDIDAFTEYHDWFFITMEVKGAGVPLNYGQTTALERLTDTILKANKTSILFICRHNVTDSTRPIFLKDTTVTEIYYCGVWYTVSPRSALEAYQYAMDWAQAIEKGGYNATRTTNPFLQ